MTNKKLKGIKAWAVIDRIGDLSPAGCTCVDKEGLWRYPIFYNRKTAQCFKDKESWAGKIIPVTITPSLGKKHYKRNK